MCLESHACKRVINCPEVVDKFKTRRSTNVTVRVIFLFIAGLWIYGHNIKRLREAKNVLVLQWCFFVVVFSITYSGCETHSKVMYSSSINNCSILCDTL